MPAARPACCAGGAECCSRCLRAGVPFGMLSASCSAGPAACVALISDSGSTARGAGRGGDVWTSIASECGPAISTTGQVLTSSSARRRQAPAVCRVGQPAPQGCVLGRWLPTLRAPCSARRAPWRGPTHPAQIKWCRLEINSVRAARRGAQRYLPGRKGPRHAYGLRTTACGQGVRGSISQVH